MKQKSIFFLTLLVFAISCSKSGDPTSTAPAANTTTATIGGQAFSATDTKITDTGTGLEFKVTSATEVLTIVTDDKKAGTYTMINAAGRIQAGTGAVATYTKGTDTYISKDGTVTITIDASGKFTITFTLNVKNAAGTVVAITGGKAEGIAATVATVPSGKCLIGSQVGAEVPGNPVTTTLVYNNDGRLLNYTQTNGGSVYYIWVNGVVVSAVETSSSGKTTKEDWFYTNGKLTSIVSSDARTETYTLNADGKPTKEIITTPGSPTYTLNWTYDTSGNVVNSSISGGASYSATLSGYDNKTNPISLLTASLGITYFPGSEDGSDFSKNNVGKRVDSYQTLTNTYTYDAKGNVLTETQNYGSGLTYLSTFTYKCN